MADPQDATVEIEHCVGCNAHQTYTWHTESKYEEYASKVGESIAQNISPDLSILVNPQPTLGRHRDVLLLRDLYSDKHCPSGKCRPQPGADNAVDATGKVACRFRYPRLGAFEIFLKIPSTNRKIQIFSKLTCGRWPTPEAVAQRIQHALQEPSRFRDDGRLVGSEQVAPAARLSRPIRSSGAASATQRSAPAQAGGFIGSAGQTRRPDVDRKVASVGLPKVETKSEGRASASESSKREVKPHAQSAKLEDLDQQDDVSKVGPDETSKHSSSKSSKHSTSDSAEKPKKRHKDKQEDSSAPAKRGSDDPTHESKGGGQSAEQSPGKPKKHKSKHSENEAESQGSLHKSEGASLGGSLKNDAYVDAESKGGAAEAYGKRKGKRGSHDQIRPFGTAAAGEVADEGKTKKKKDKYEATAADDKSAVSADGKKKKKKDRGEADGLHEAAEAGGRESSPDSKKKKKDQTKVASESSIPDYPDSNIPDGEKKKKKKKDEAKEPSEAGPVGDQEAGSSEKRKKKKENDDAKGSSEADAAGDQEAVHSENKKKKKKENDDTKGPSEAGDGKTNADGKKKKKEKDEVKTSPEAEEGGGEESSSHEVKKKKKKEKAEAADPSGAADQGPEAAVSSEGKKKKKKDKDEAKDFPEGAAAPENDTGSSEAKKKKKKEKDESKNSPGAGDGGGDDPASAEGKKKTKDKDEVNDSSGAAAGSEAAGNSDGKKKKKKEKDDVTPEKQEESSTSGKEGKSRKKADNENKDRPPSSSGAPSFSSHPAAPLTRNYELTLPVGTKQTQRLSYQNPNSSGLDLLLVSSDPDLMVPKGERQDTRGLQRGWRSSNDNN